ncbi:MAG: hypothetical protein AUG44_06105 [Actinobacteria bacterium 13_1_20CM_3_71_11]|nr:MAG: hypothetical protein AUG44_06105 [Actinobacteria bacterium 13_1_20CM_3_71_11]
MLALAAALVSFLISLAGDVLLADRFDSGSRDRGGLLIDRISGLFGVHRFSHALPSLLIAGSHVGNLVKFACWTAVVAGFTIAVWLLGRRTPADRVPVPALPPLTVGRWTGRGGTGAPRTPSFPHQSADAA